MLSIMSNSAFSTRRDANDQAYRLVVELMYRTESPERWMFWRDCMRLSAETYCRMTCDHIRHLLAGKVSR